LAMIVFVTANDSFESDMEFELADSSELEVGGGPFTCMRRCRFRRGSRARIECFRDCISRNYMASEEAEMQVAESQEKAVGPLLALTFFLCMKLAAKLAAKKALVYAGKKFTAKKLAAKLGKREFKKHMKRLARKLYGSESRAAGALADRMWEGGINI